jgi:hypothetical protein
MNFRTFSIYIDSVFILIGCASGRVVHFGESSGLFSESLNFITLLADNPRNQAATAL